MSLQEIIIQLHEIAREQPDIRMDSKIRAIADELAIYDNIIRESQCQTTHNNV